MKDVSETENAIMNPQITDVEIGIRNLRKIKIYPLSMGGQLKITDVIEKTIKDYFKRNPEGGTDVGIATMIMRMITENIYTFMGLITEEEDSKKVLDEMSNMQMSEVIKIVYEKNFKDPFEKNLKSLFSETLGKMFQSERPLPQSSSDMEDTDLKTSTEEGGQKEE